MNCPLCAEIAPDHLLEDVLIHVFYEHLPEYETFLDGKKCFCGFTVLTPEAFLRHISGSHDTYYLDWMYDAYHQQMLGAEP